MSQHNLEDQTPPRLDFSHGLLVKFGDFRFMLKQNTISKYKNHGNDNISIRINIHYGFQVVVVSKCSTTTTIMMMML